MATDRLGIEIGDMGSKKVVTVTGRAVDTELPKLTKALRDLARDGAAGVVVDLSGVEYICSWGLGVLVEQSDAISNTGTAFSVVQPQGRLRELFGLLQMHLVLPLFDSVEAALCGAPRVGEEEVS